MEGVIAPFSRVEQDERNAKWDDLMGTREMKGGKVVSQRQARNDVIL